MRTVGYDAPQEPATPEPKVYDGFDGSDDDHLMLTYEQDDVDITPINVSNCNRIFRNNEKKMKKQN